MPIREYECVDRQRGCDFCKAGFEQIEKIDQAPLSSCPKCGAPVTRRLSAPSIGRLASHFDDRAKKAGFHKLKRLGQGEYEKQY